MKQTTQIVLAVCAMFVASAAFAATGSVPDPEIPNWFYAICGVMGTAISFVSHVDAQVSEEFKAKWPWWLRWLWNRAAGNYKHSQNIGSR